MHENFQNQRFLIVFDLDGTLLTTEQKIAPSTKKMVSQLQSMGNIISLASGRPSRAIYPFYEELQLKGPYICYNGAMINNPDDPDFERIGRSTPSSVILELIRHFGEDFFANFMIENEEDQYYLKKNEEYLFFFHPEGIRVHIGSAEDMIHDDMMASVFETKTESDNLLVRDYVKSHFPGMGYRIWLDAPRFGELFYEDINKATALKEIASHYHIDKEHTIAFGDAMNDLQMLMEAGISFTMANGAEPLKKLTTYVTRYDNNHDGIADALKTLFRFEESS